MLQSLILHVNKFIVDVATRIKRWTKPSSASLIVNTLADLSRSKAELIIENTLLRQQLIVLNRQVKRPCLSTSERLRMVVLARLTQHWQTALHIVQPNTLLRWHRDLFRCYWRWKSRAKSYGPRIEQSTIALIQQMATENRLWGAERIRGELLKVGIKVSKRTIQKYRPTRKHRPNQTWRTFLKNHSQDIWACDFTVVHDLLFRPIYIFLIMHVETRRIVHTAVTKAPTDVWTAQQLREATPWGKSPKYLIRDRDKKYGTAFTRVAKSTSIEELVTPIRAPKANALCERAVGSLKRECLDHVLLFNEKQCQRVVSEYANYYNELRPHQGIGQKIPNRLQEEPLRSTRVTITVRPILNGLHHSYAYA